jgi:diguanylate cyclase (GGDEF)-like protein
MPAAPLPPDEAERLACLRACDVLDTAAEEAFTRLARFAGRLAGTPIALVSLIDADRQWFKARVGLDVDETPRDRAFCAHAILRPGEPLIVPDALKDSRFADNPLVTGAPGIRFYAGVPLVTEDGHALGTLCVIDRVPRELQPEQVEALTLLAGTVSTSLELRRAMRRAQQLAMTDALTGLGNRPAFLDRLDGAVTRLRRAEEPFTLAYLDLDGFKRVNDVHGHPVGDELLREVAAGFAQCLRRQDFAARIGGDEFAALLGGAAAEGPALAERLRLAIKERMDARGWPVTASIGLVAFHAAPDDVTEALSAADELMYRAKAAGKNRVLHGEYRTRPGALAA